MHCNKHRKRSEQAQSPEGNQTKIHSNVSTTSWPSLAHSKWLSGVLSTVPQAQEQPGRFEEAAQIEQRRQEKTSRAPKH